MIMEKFVNEMLSECLEVSFGFNLWLEKKSRNVL
jgi:hypothetical protein